MVIKQKNLIFNIYCTLVFLTYILSVNIVPPSIQWVSNKLWILSLFVLSILALSGVKYKIKNSFIMPLVLLFFYSITSSYSYFLHFNISTALKTSFASSLLYFLLFFTIANISTYFTAKELLKPFLVSSSIVILLSILVYLGFEPTFYFDDKEELDKYLTLKFGGVLIGFSGIYLNQNNFGVTLIVAIATIFAITVTNNHSTRKIRSIIFFILLTAFVFLMLTVSRASILAVLLILILYLIKSYRKKSSFYMTIIIILVLIMLYFYFNEQVDYLVNRVENDGTSGRTEIWSDAIRKFYNSPWFGVGNYKYISATGNELSAHNVYINKLVSEGVLSMIFWASWLMYGLCSSIKTYFKSKDKISIIIAASFIGILVHQVFESTISNIYSILTLFLMVVYTLNFKVKINNK